MKKFLTILIITVFIGCAGETTPLQEVDIGATVEAMVAKELEEKKPEPTVIPKAEPTVIPESEPTQEIKKTILTDAEIIRIHNKKNELLELFNLDESANPWKYWNESLNYYNSELALYTALIEFYLSQSNDVSNKEKVIINQYSGMSIEVLLAHRVFGNGTRVYYELVYDGYNPVSYYDFLLVGKNSVVKLRDVRFQDSEENKRIISLLGDEYNTSKLRIAKAGNLLSDKYTIYDNGKPNEAEFDYFFIPEHKLAWKIFDYDLANESLPEPTPIPTPAPEPTIIQSEIDIKDEYVSNQAKLLQDGGTEIIQSINISICGWNSLREYGYTPEYIINNAYSSNDKKLQEYSVRAGIGCSLIWADQPFKVIQSYNNYLNSSERETYLSLKSDFINLQSEALFSTNLYSSVRAINTATCNWNTLIQYGWPALEILNSTSLQITVDAAIIALGCAAIWDIDDRQIQEIKY